MKHPTLAVSFLLLVQAFHLASPQSTAAIPGPTINQSWNRDLPESSTLSQNSAANVEERENERTNEDYSSGTASDSMEEENMVVRQTGNNGTVFSTTLPPFLRKGETNQPTPPATTVSPVNSDKTTLGKMISTVTEKQSPTDQPTKGSTLPPKVTTLPPNTTTSSSKSSTADQKTASSRSPEIYNGTDLHKTTRPSPETPTMPTTDKGLHNSTGPYIPTTVETSKEPEINKTSPTSPGSTAAPESTTMPPVTTEAAAAAAGDGSERGSVSNPELRSRQQAWGAVLGTAVVVACVGLVVYIVMKRKNPKGFTHRKLVEEFPSDPVLRLDNSEPLDLNFGRSGFTNPGLQSDHIQMSNIPGGR